MDLEPELSVLASIVARRRMGEVVQGMVSCLVCCSCCVFASLEVVLPMLARWAQGAVSRRARRCRVGRRSVADDVDVLLPRTSSLGVRRDIHAGGSGQRKEEGQEDTKGASDGEEAELTVHACRTETRLVPLLQLPVHRDL